MMPTSPECPQCGNTATVRQKGVIEVQKKIKPIWYCAKCRNRWY